MPSSTSKLYGPGKITSISELMEKTGRPAAVEPQQRSSSRRPQSKKRPAPASEPAGTTQG